MQWSAEGHIGTHSVQMAAHVYGVHFAPAHAAAEAQACNMHAAGAARLNDERSSLLVFTVLESDKERRKPFSGQSCLMISEKNQADCTTPWLGTKGDLRLRTLELRCKRLQRVLPPNPVR
jgi:hypothetical protein